MGCVSLGLTGLLSSVMVMLIPRSSYTLPKWLSTFRQIPRSKAKCANRLVVIQSGVSHVLDRLLMQDRINASAHTSLAARQHGYGS